MEIRQFGTGNYLHLYKRLIVHCIWQWLHPLHFDPSTWFLKPLSRGKFS